MKKQNIIMMIIAVIVFLSFVAFATYAYFTTGNLNITNVVNANTVTEQNNMVFDVIGGNMSLNMSLAKMVEGAANNNVATISNNTTLTVNFTPNTDYSMVCTYDIVFEWTSSDKYIAHSPGVTNNEFTIQGTLVSNAHVSEGTNSISSETDLSTLTYTSYAATVVSGAQIDGTGSSTSTAVWNLISRVYNVEANQTALEGKNFAGKFKIANVSCVAGEVVKPGPTSYWFDSINCTIDSPCEYGTYNGTTYTSGPLGDDYAYIGQDSSRYYACGTDGDGHEVCLSQPYTQYGLGEHTPGSDFTVDQQLDAIQALHQHMYSSGMQVTLSDDVYINSDTNSVDDRTGCMSGPERVNCNDNSNSIVCYITKDGSIGCYDFYTRDYCDVDFSGGAGCYDSGEDW